MLSRISRGRRISRKSLSPRIQSQVFYLFQPCRNLSNTRGSAANVTDGEKVPPKEVKKLLASFLVKPGSDIKLEDIIERLPQLPADHHLHLNSALFLVTPSLAKAFEPSHPFHVSLINHIFRQRSLGPRPQSVVAVVDAISNIDPLVPSYESVQDGEGIAVCISDRLGTVEEDGSSDVPLIRFSEAINHTSTRPRAVSYLAPVANTLFINGSEHTMVRQDWKPDSQGSWVRDFEPAHLNSIDVSVNDGIGQYTNFTDLHTTLEILTEPARVKSSMGNIVRELKIASGATISASTELEDIIPSLLKSRNSSGDEGEFRVYALVYPESHGYVIDDDFKIPMKLPEKQDDGPTRIKGRMMRSLLKNGGRIYRVTSGGGGWGKRAGLLSLEPRVDVRHRNVSEPASPEFIFSDDGVTMPDSKQLIPPGSVIQFLATFCGRKYGRKSVSEEIAGDMVRPVLNTESWNSDSWFDGDQIQSMCIGTSSVTELPETVTPNLVPQHSGPAEASRSHSNMTFLPNKFGFLSSSPMGIVCVIHHEHLDGRSTISASKSAHSSSALDNDDRASQSSVKTFTTLIEPPGTSFTMNFFADGSKDIKLENSALKKGMQQTRPVMRKLIVKWREEVLTPRKAARGSLRLLSENVQASDANATKVTKSAENTKDMRNIEGTKSRERIEETSKTQKVEPSDSTTKSKRMITTCQTRFARTLDRDPCPKTTSFDVRIGTIEKMLLLIESNLGRIQTILDDTSKSIPCSKHPSTHISKVSGPPLESTLPQMLSISKIFVNQAFRKRFTEPLKVLKIFVGPRRERLRNRLHIRRQRMSISKFFAADTIFRKYISGRLQISKFYAKPPEQSRNGFRTRRHRVSVPKLSINKSFRKYLGGRSQYSKFYTQSREQSRDTFAFRTRRRRLSATKHRWKQAFRKFTTKGPNISKFKVRLRLVRYLAGSQSRKLYRKLLGPVMRKTEPGLETMHMRRKRREQQAELFLRDQAEFKRLVRLSADESEEAILTTSITEKMAADVTNVNSGKPDTRPFSTEHPSYSVSLYGNVSDRARAKIAVDGLMKDLEED